MLIERTNSTACQDPEEVCSKSPFRVLVVEDDLVHFTYCEHVLNLIYGDKLVLERAVDCQSAIDMLNSREFEICLLDYLVKGGDAKDILARVDFGHVTTPVIVVSAFDDREFVLEALRHGADDYVIKGKYSENELHQAIQYAIYRKYKELRLRQRALYDPLTGLANRHLLFDRLEEVHRFSSRHGEKFAVMVIDLDKLKAVNDTLGHEAGDRLIQSSANAMVASLRASDTVARIGGDEFIAILKNIRDKAGLARICDTMRKAVADKAMVETGLADVVTCSIGVSVFPDDSTSTAELLRQADAAMYTIKRDGGDGFSFV
ncbi:GGDEF domain-containing response regulator [Magnetospirillum sp. SS-4]|uniref:two-component system response regulator n=1 Tax=Magnetospirillum sp. SS-4 TaxID=2681465 RepID=UPI001384981B|nr:GGDEF domain-containing response regulator [Magnetospirillum sp. SS-4]CAA7624845.1 Response regulator containing a CheY-like receiver domain and a GGDEF domain [Magnetospirillum sp. SS-4]